MAFEAFNSVGGYSVGIPPTPVINANGIATLPGLQVSGISNLGSINNVIILGGVDGYYLQTNGEGGLTWAPAGNGGGGNGVPGGSNSEVQFNNDGNFGGDPGFTYNNVTNQLSISGNIVSTNVVASGNVSATNVVASGNISGGNLNVTKITATGNISAGNANLGNYVTANFYAGNGYMLSGVISASSNTANYANYAGNVTIAGQANITSVGTLTSLNVSGNVTAARFIGSGTSLSNINGSNVVGQVFESLYTGTVLTNAQPNIRSLGTLVNLTVSGNVILGNVSNVHVYGGNSGQVLTTNGSGNLTWENAPASVTATYVTANYQPNITSTGTLTVLTVNGISTLGNVGNVKITGGSNGYVLSTDGSGNLSWASGSSGIGGSNTQIQYNNNGNFAADANFTYNTSTNTVTVTGDLVANSLTIGSGAYKFSRTSVYFATSVTTSETLLMTFPTSDTAGLDVTIISTDASAGNRQICKLEAVYYANTVHYSEYNTIQVNGPVGNFAITYEPGNISIPATASLYVFPTTSNMTTYKIQVTSYQE